MRTMRSMVVWGVRYGLPGMVIRRSARRGDLISRTAIDPVVLAEPFAAYDELRARGPVTRNKLISATASHAVANAVLRDERFVVGPTSAPANWLGKLVAASVDPNVIGPGEPPSLLALQPPQHTRIRRLVSRAFTPRAVAGLAGRIRGIADELLDDIAAGPASFDLIETYAALLPVTVIAEIIGVPTTERKRFLQWGANAALTLDPGLSWREYRLADGALREAHGFLAEHVAALRRDPGEDLLSTLVHIVDEGDRLSDVELRTTALLLLGAGFETTVKLIGNSAALLLAHPEQLDGLRANPEGWGNAVEESLRYDSPVQLTLRFTPEATELHGMALPAGWPLLVLLGGANRDPAVFPDPHRFDVTRPNAREHLAFSSGIHYCLGAQLARMEAVIGLQALFDRFPDLAMDGAAVRGGTRVLRGYRHLPLRRHAGASSTSNS